MIFHVLITTPTAVLFREDCHANKHVQAKGRMVGEDLRRRCFIDQTVNPSMRDTFIHARRVEV